jgi:NTE family protein
MDGLFTDLEHLLHVNRLLENFNQEAVSEKSIACHVIVPSIDIREIAMRHQHHLPRSVRLFMAGTGGSGSESGQLVSYLLFDKHYTHDLITLGYEDAMQQRDALLNFFVADEIPFLVAPERICAQLESGGCQ